MKLTTQQRIYNNYLNGKDTKIGKYYYSIQYHPMANYTFIIRCVDGFHEWKFHEPLDKSIKADSRFTFLNYDGRAV